MRYYVDILDQPFIWEHHYLSKKTAVVHFTDSEGRLVRRHEYAYLELAQIHQAIKNYEPILIEHAYIKDLSLSELRTVPYERIYIKQLEFEKCFIDGDTDFSTVEVSEGIFAFKSCYFGDGDFDMRGSRFLGGILSFEETTFGNGNKYMMNCRFGNGVVDFSNVHFGDGNFFMEQFEAGDAAFLFTDSKFGTGMKRFRGIKLGKGDVSFKGVHFADGDIDFVECNHRNGFWDFRNVHVSEGDVNFGGAHFGTGDIDFSGAVFSNGMVGFSNVHFQDGNIYMIGTQFLSGNVYFNRSYFGTGDINFVGTIFSGKLIDFSECRFENGFLNFNGSSVGTADLDFNHTQFGEMVVMFTGTDITGGKMQMLECQASELIFSGVSFGCHVYMNVKHCNQLVLENCIIEKTFDLRPTAETKHRTIEALRLSGTKNLGHIYIDWIDSDVKDAIYATKNVDELDLAYQFRLLKENFRNIGQYDDEDFAYIEFKRCERRARYSKESIECETKKMNLKGLQRLLYIIRKKMYGALSYFIFDLVGRYGTSPRNVFVTMINTVIFFTLIYAMPFVEMSRTTKFIIEDSPIKRRLMLAFYHSVETFLTIGYGDVNPDNLVGTLISAFEGFCGVFLMSYFTITFVRKLLR